MGRKKQRRPHRSVGIVECPDTDLNKPNDQNENGGTAVIDEPFFVEVERNCWVSSEHYDISEVLLTNLSISPEFHGFNLSDDFFQDSSYAFRFRMCDVSKLISRIKLGHWPIVPASSVCLELVHMRVSEDKETPVVMVSGSFDGPDEGVSGLAHLASLKSLTLRPILGATLLDSLSSVRVRVEILKSAFDECESLLDNRKQLWKKSMMSVMAWLRPEVTTSEARYGCSVSTDIEIDSPMETNEASSAPRKRAGFDVAGFYEAVKPSKEDPMLENDMPDLLPKLRPYQLRAAYWMVQREKGASGCLSGSEKSQFIYPLCTPVEFIDTCSRMFYNPFSGNISLRPENSTPYVFGGILAGKSLPIML
ncbi:hypothetical protein RJ640_026239 [Escallonia rubra]|uniref:Uncharacterized protein n=1 Tax=Escallonia rubra TaxID=112253 RepID=A0AA88UHM2_9ASTE|nr:hypothetical protein RJ640_026239 [Escallonia rubra]